MSAPGGEEGDGGGEYHADFLGAGGGDDAGGEAEVAGGGHGGEIEEAGLGGGQEQRSGDGQGEPAIVAEEHGIEHCRMKQQEGEDGEAGGGGEGEADEKAVGKQQISGAAGEFEQAENPELAAEGEIEEVVEEENEGTEEIGIVKPERVKGVRKAGGLEGEGSGEFAGDGEIVPEGEGAGELADPQRGQQEKEPGNYERPRVANQAVKDTTGRGVYDEKAAARMGYFSHQTALVETKAIGDGTRIWAYAHVLAGARIGRDCNVCDHTFIENDVVLGDRVTVKCGVQLWDGITIEDDVFIGPNATFTNDPFPRSKQRPAEFSRTVVRRGASIGANATVLPGLEIGPGAMVGAGAVVTHSVPPHAIVAGNPARITGYSTTESAVEAAVVAPPEAVGPRPTALEGVTVHRLPRFTDLRGSLSYGEVSRHVPFEVKRYFVVFGVSGKEVRGEHAHRRLEQFLVCVSGSCQVLVDDGVNRQEILLNAPDIGIHVRPMVWVVHYHYSPDAVLLVLASDHYDAADYVRDYNEFLALGRG